MPKELFPVTREKALKTRLSFSFFYHFFKVIQQGFIGLARRSLASM